MTALPILTRSLRPARASLLLGALVTSLLVATAGCGAPAPSTPSPDTMVDDWPVSSLAEQGIDASLLAELEGRIADGTYASPDSLLIARNGKLVYERYWNGFDRDKPHDLRSATKSITSLLVGIAVDRGVLAGVDQRVFSFFPAAMPPGGADERRDRMTLEHLLTMSSGLDCDDWTPASPGNEEKMYSADDWTRFILDLPMHDEPGAHPSYCTGGVVVLGSILAGASKVAVPDFARDHLFAPLRMKGFHWQSTPEGGTDTGGHLQLRPRDFAKIGQLVLDKGTWGGASIVKPSWIAASTQNREKLGDSSYGYLWWLNTFNIAGTPVDIVFARGNGGQDVFVLPSLGMVVAFTSSHYNEPEGDQPIEMCGKYIARAALPKK